MKDYIIKLSLILLSTIFLLCSCSTSESKQSNTTSKNPIIYERPELDTISPLYTFNENQEGENNNNTNFATYKITYSARLIFNNHVGDNWKYGLNCNGLSVENNSNIRISNKSTPQLTAYIVECDKYNDYGSTKISYNCLNIGESQTKDIIIIVRENQGRYEGNIAKWYFEITLKRLS